MLFYTFIANSVQIYIGKICRYSIIIIPCWAQKNNNLGMELQCRNGSCSGNRRRIYLCMLVMQQCNSQTY